MIGEKQFVLNNFIIVTVFFCGCKTFPPSTDWILLFNQPMFQGRPQRRDDSDEFPFRPLGTYLRQINLC
jgi:hypothetical protein